MLRNSLAPICRGRGASYPMPITTNALKEYLEIPCLKTYHPDQLVHASKPFFRLNAGLHLKLIPLLVPYLELLIITAHEVSTNLMVEHAKHPAAPVFTW